MVLKQLGDFLLSHCNSRVCSTLKSSLSSSENWEFFVKKNSYSSFSPLMPKRPKIKSSRGPLQAKRAKTTDTPFATYGKGTNPVTTMALRTDTTVLATPVKSANDEKDYRVIKLKNGLTALLISDTSYSLEKLDEEEQNEAEEELDEDSEGEFESEEEDEESEDEEMGPKRNPVVATGLKMSAAGLCINMGSFSDPTDIPGLAHFLEHMVFMGSKKFPDENSFDAFNRKVGGSDNASTDCETTIFYFETPRRHFHEGLDRFAQFFISPLMKQDSMEREREAVDSEFQMALPSDFNRKELLFGSLAKAGHPMTKFMWGNHKSLTPEGMSDEEVHKRLHEFRERHYTAQSMCLAIQGQQTLDTLQAWVEETFSEVQNNQLEREKFDSMTGPFQTENFSKIYRIIPVQNVYQIDLNWAYPALLSAYKVKPLHYLSWIIGHEGRGSLISYFRRKVWALALTAGNAGDGFEYNSTYSIFSITITLTKEGYNNLDKVLEAVFGYIKMLKENEPSERIYGEIKRIEDLNFAFREETQPGENVETLCENMHFYPPERYLDGDDLMFEYDADLLKTCTNDLRTDNVNIFIMSKDIPSETLDKVEQWFGTSYSEKDIPTEWRDSWNATTLSSEFHLPEENKFIADDTSLRDADIEPSKFPVKIISDNLGELFFKKDEGFKQPRAYIYYLLRSPLQLESLENSILLDMLVNCLLQNIVEDVYPADLAQLEYSIHAAEQGMLIRVNGLSEKLPRLLETIVDHLSRFEADIKEEMLCAVLDQLIKNYHNHSIQPNKLVRDIRLGVLQDSYFSPRAKLAKVRSVTCDQVKNFATEFKKNVFLQGLVQGNLTSAEAKATDANMRSKLNLQPITGKTEIRCREIKQGEVTIRVDSLNNKDANTMVVNYYQAEKAGDIYHHGVLEVVSMMMEEPVFDVLRTQEQLGYHVFNTLRNTHGVLGISISVNTQATKFQPEHVDQRIEKFLEQFVKEHLSDDEEFVEAVTALSKLKVKADVTLQEEVNRNWDEIVSKEYLFNRFEKEVEVFSKLSLEEVKSYFGSLVLSSDKRRKMSVQVVGSSEPGDPEEDLDGKLTSFELKYHQGDHLLEDPDTYKKTLQIYPTVYIVE